MEISDGLATERFKHLSAVLNPRDFMVDTRSHHLRKISIVLTEIRFVTVFYI
jgi:hypothetical protein